MTRQNVSILIVDDEDIVRNSLSGWLEEDGYQVDTAQNAYEALEALNRRTWELYFLDIKMPGMDGVELHHKIREVDPQAIVIMITAYAAVDTAVRALKDGAYDYITKPFDPEDISRLVHNAARQRQLEKENIELKDQLEDLTRAPKIIGNSKHIHEINDLIDTVAPTDTTVIIRGESGTGKELVARAIHSKSKRKFFPMVIVNCGALSESLLESELFGHEKGAFTGAMQRRKGKLELADKGTLFLDEIGTLTPKTQIDLLRAIENKEFTRLGGNEVIHTDFRLICATNADLEQAIREGTFREDLFYRLQVYTIQLRPLRERPEDIPDLVRFFIERYKRAMNKPVGNIENKALSMLMNYQWPGNIRELENAIERAMVVVKGNVLRKEHFILNNSIREGMPSDLSLKEIEKKHILSVLDRFNWNISQAARILGIDRVTIYKKLKEYGISREQHV